MPILQLNNPVFISVTKAGRANSGGTVGVYEADGLFTTFATIYPDQIKTTELSNPVTLDDAGTKEIWYDVKVDTREKTKAGALIRDTLNLDPNAAQASVQGFNLAQNGSFEIDSESDGQPDNWTISSYTGSAIAITSDVVTNGAKALEFNTTGAGTGGGTATSAKFPVTESSLVAVSWSFYATNAATLNTFQIRWYDEDDVLKSTSTLTMPISGSAPTSWTTYQEVVTVDVAGTQGEIVLVGIASGGFNLSSKAYFDGISVINDPSITSPVINGVRVSGMVVLDAPELLATQGDGWWSAGSWISTSNVASTTLTDAKAKTAIVKVLVGANAGVSTNAIAIGAIRKGGTSLTTSNGTIIATDMNGLDTANADVTAYGEGVVNLDSSYDFEYYGEVNGLTLNTFSLWLIGYYV